MSRFVKSRMSRVAGGALMIVLALSATGCVIYPEKHDFGDAVRQMRLVQATSDRMPVAPEDGDYAGAVLDSYRTDVASPKQIHNAIVINVGTGGQAGQ